MNWPSVARTKDEIIIRIPRSGRTQAVKNHVDFSYLKGICADVETFRGKTSVEVQHMLTQIWAGKYSL